MSALAADGASSEAQASTCDTAIYCDKENVDPSTGVRVARAAVSPARLAKRASQRVVLQDITPVYVERKEDLEANVKSSQTLAKSTRASTGAKSSKHAVSRKGGLSMTVDAENQCNSASVRVQAAKSSRVPGRRGLRVRDGPRVQNCH